MSHGITPGSVSTGRPCSITQPPSLTNPSSHWSARPYSHQPLRTRVHPGMRRSKSTWNTWSRLCLRGYRRETPLPSLIIWQLQSVSKHYITTYLGPLNARSKHMDLALRTSSRGERSSSRGAMSLIGNSEKENNPIVKLTTLGATSSDDPKTKMSNDFST